MTSFPKTLLSWRWVCAQYNTWGVFGIYFRSTFFLLWIHLKTLIVNTCAHLFLFFVRTKYLFAFFILFQIPLLEANTNNKHRKKRPTGIPLSNYKLCGLCHIFFSFSLFPIEWSECSVIRLCGSFILHAFNNELKIKPFPWPIWNSISPIHSRNDSAHMSHFPLADARIWGKSILILIFIQEENEAINRANPPHFNEHNICGFFFIFFNRSAPIWSGAAYLTGKYVISSRNEERKNSEKIPRRGPKTPEKLILIVKWIGLIIARARTIHSINPKMSNKVTGSPN